MIRYKSSRQLSISEFKMPFEAKLDENNRWVVLSKIVPWEEFARLYYKNFKSNRGAPTKDARLVLGVIIIKHIMKTDDRGVIEMIQENPYMQYFLGLEAFTYEQVMTPSLLVSIRKRIDLDVFESLTDDLIRKGLKLKAGVKPEEVDTNAKDDDNDDEDPGNRGKLQMDATVCDADIKYPTDLDLLNESRQKAEELIDELCLKLGIKDKPRTYRRVARKEFLDVSKMKRKPANVLRKAIRKQINYLKRDIRNINKMLDTVKDKPVPFDRRQLKYFFVIQHLLAQQETMYRKKSHQVEDRIVSIHQPHVRPIVRGKAKAKTEFGAKINISLLDGYARVDHLDWDAFNEGQDLQMQVERFRELTGKYPELVQVDKIYLTRENRRFLKEKGIRYTGDPLGRKPAKEIKSRYQKRKERREAAERNQVEGKFGQGKRGYDMNNIRAKLPTTSSSWIGAIIFVMNLIRHMRDIPLSLFVSFVSNVMKLKNINIYPVKAQMKFCA
ncbi:IS5 family transposase [Petrimonas sp.]|uniref:IS5 family transposase n=1 Tax=Petrimonas sp. TaxID=2023866 RepID=UPI002FCB0B21